LLIGAVFALDALFPLFNLQQPRTWAGIAFAAVGVTLVFTMLALKVRPLWFLPLLLVYVIPQWKDDYILLFHGLMHSSFVYECLLRGVPPENPLMAGEPLRYMYGLHYFIAAIMRVIPINPLDGFAIANGVSLLAFAVLMERIAARISTDPVYRVLTVVLALFSMDLFVDGPIQQIAAAIWGPHRYGPVIALMKMTGVNSNGVGMVCFAMGLLAIVRLMTRTGGQVGSYLLLASGSLLAIFIYQPAWMAIGAFALSSSVLVLILRYKELQREAWMVLGVFIATSILGLPVLLSMVDDSSSGAAVRILPSLYQLRLNLKFLILNMVAPVALLLLARQYVIDVVRRQLMLFAFLALSVAALAGSYLVLRLPSGNEYKFLLFASSALAPIVAVPLHRLYQEHRGVAFAAVFLFMVPFMTDFTFLMLPQPIQYHVHAEGRRIHAVDPAQDELNSWIWEHTPTNAVFVDSQRTVPPLAGRQLFVALDLWRDPRLDQGQLQDGWLISSEWFLTEIIHVDANKKALRQKLATTLLADPGTIDTALLTQIHDATPTGRPLYVIARRDEQKTRMQATPALKKVYEGAGGMIFQMGQ